MSQVLLVQNSYNVINYNLKEVLVALNDFATVTCHVQNLRMLGVASIPHSNPMMFVKLNQIDQT